MLQRAEHRTGDVQLGEAWSHRIYDAAIASPLWPHLAAPAAGTGGCM